MSESRVRSDVLLQISDQLGVVLLLRQERTAQEKEGGYDEQSKQFKTEHICVVMYDIDINVSNRYLILYSKFDMTQNYNLLIRINKDYLMHTQYLI